MHHENAERRVVRSSISVYLPERDHALLRTHAASLDHDEVVVHFTVMREATHRRDALIGKIVFRRGVVLHDLQISNDIKMNINPDQ